MSGATSRGRSAVDRLAAGSRPSTPVLVVLAVLGVLVAVLLVAWRQAGADERSERAALAVARERAQQITTYDQATFDDDVAWARTGATARFRREYAAANAPIREAAERLRARASGRVVRAAATARGDDRVQVLLFVDQTLTRAGREQRTQESRLVMTMVHRDGRWLVDDVVLV
ncbi:MAG: hypothetical protein PGN07_05230 [Aeromicrobium erythreum]